MAVVDKVVPDPRRTCPALASLYLMALIVFQRDLGVVWRAVLTRVHQV